MYLYYWISHQCDKTWQKHHKGRELCFSTRLEVTMQPVKEGYELKWPHLLLIRQEEEEEWGLTFNGCPQALGTHLWWPFQLKDSQSSLAHSLGPSVHHQLDLDCQALWGSPLLPFPLEPFIAQALFALVLLNQGPIMGALAVLESTKIILPWFPGSGISNTQHHSRLSWDLHKYFLA